MYRNTNSQPRTYPQYTKTQAEQEVATQKGQISKLEHTRTTLEANVRQLTVQHEAMQRERDTHSTSEYRMKELFDSMQMTLNDHQHARQVDITRMVRIRVVDVFI
ncbi:hypothetical protein SARC_16221 [Sphaeroforma arctica JP610]|uniref:Uncharacterized protein n=1 Tax=Sphaeroforma arctica JP610 TaxID=667725 RepID=A0A0L0F3H3_9EUKA|nr:hypothetical protein SARC_16221 [Sphaeroforma arctica JP610]KNC71242.1 hypothetical protein SARC_16221 [Sphaeroforma arctica JP610]|eukprot:XP_014145144.1 hypothetical protein SARC_16221 [Sphaeroforma arctica JP610]